MLFIVAWCGPKNDQKARKGQENSHFIFSIATDELKYLVHDRICQRGISGCGFIPPWFLIDLIELKYYIICNFRMRTNADHALILNLVWTGIIMTIIKTDEKSLTMS